MNNTLCQAVWMRSGKYSKELSSDADVGHPGCDYGYDFDLTNCGGAFHDLLDRVGVTSCAVSNALFGAFRFLVRARQCVFFVDPLSRVS